MQIRVQLPDAIGILLHDEIIEPLIDTFLGFLNAVAGPLIFCLSYGASTVSVMPRRSVGWENTSASDMVGIFA